MATSGTYTDHPNNLATISAALRKIGRLGDHETLVDTDNRYTASLAALKLICKSFAVMGMPLWAIDEVEIPFSNFTTISGVTIGLSGNTITQVAPLKIIQAMRRDTTEDIDEPMLIYTADDYNLIPQKASTGAPLTYTYIPMGPDATNAAHGHLRVWPLPDTYWSANGAIFIRYQRPFQDVGASTKDLDFPQEWSRAIVYTLACDIAPEYGIDINQRDRLEKTRDRIVAETIGFGTEEGSFRIQPRKR
jgi:hypothetical protein